MGLGLGLDHAGWLGSFCSSATNGPPKNILQDVAVKNGQEM